VVAEPVLPAALLQNRADFGGTIRDRTISRAAHVLQPALPMTSPKPEDVYSIVSEPFALWAFIRDCESAPPSEAPATWRPNSSRASQLDAERPTLVDIPRRCSSSTQR